LSNAPPPNATTGASLASKSGNSACRSSSRKWASPCSLKICAIGLRLDAAVQVDEASAQAVPELLPERGLAGGHETGEEKGARHAESLVS
jgi:hypothetical protein